MTASQNNNTSLFVTPQINRVIVHFLIRNFPENTLVFQTSKELTNIVNEGVDTIKERVITAIGEKSHALEMLFNSSSEDVFKSIVAMFSLSLTDDEFIKQSQQLGKYLHSAQKSNRAIPDGAVLIIQGSIGENSRKCVVIIKAETKSGFKLEVGDASSQVEFIERLFLTPHEKLYKVAMIIDNHCKYEKEKDEVYEDFEYEIGDVRVFIYDSNTNTNKDTPGAKYFYNTFMGCNFHKNNAIQTLFFYNNTKSYIDNNYNDNQEKRYDLNSALKVYLKLSNEQTISMTKFADSYIDTQDERNSYFSYMKEKGGPTGTIQKDLTKLKNVLKRQKIKFANDIYLSGPQDTFKDNIKILNRDQKEKIHENIDSLVKRKGIDEFTVVMIRGRPASEE